jgi:hypothetical protein
VLAAPYTRTNDQHTTRYGVRLLDGRSIKIRKSAFDLLRDGEVIESPRFDSVPNSPQISTPSSTNSRPYKAMSHEPPPLSLSGEEIPYPTSSSYAGALQHRKQQRRSVKHLHPHINNYDDALDEEEDDEEEEAEYEEDSEEDEQVTTYPYCDIAITTAQTITSDTEFLDLSMQLHKEGHQRQADYNRAASLTWLGRRYVHALFARWILICVCVCVFLCLCACECWNVALWWCVKDIESMTASMLTPLGIVRLLL